MSKLKFKDWENLQIDDELWECAPYGCIRIRVIRKPMLLPRDDANVLTFLAIDVNTGKQIHYTANEDYFHYAPHLSWEKDYANIAY